MKAFYGIIAIINLIAAFVCAMNNDLPFTVLNIGLLLMNVIFMNNEK